MALSSDCSGALGGKERGKCQGGHQYNKVIKLWTFPIPLPGIYRHIMTIIACIIAYIIISIITSILIMIISFAWSDARECIATTTAPPPHWKACCSSPPSDCSVREGVNKKKKRFFFRTLSQTPDPTHRARLGLH